MHKHTTHNKSYASVRDFSIAMLDFLPDDVPKNWNARYDEVMDNLRIINLTKFQTLT